MPANRDDQVLVTRDQPDYVDGDTGQVISVDAAGQSVLRDYRNQGGTEQFTDFETTIMEIRNRTYKRERVVGEFRHKYEGRIDARTNRRQLVYTIYYAATRKRCFKQIWPKDDGCD